MSLKRSINELLSRSDGEPSRMYQCSNCRHRFEAPENSNTVCPDCQSDDLTPL